MTTVGPNNHHDKWVAALEAKFEQKGAEFGKQEFDELFTGFNVSRARQHIGNHCHITRS